MRAAAVSILAAAGALVIAAAARPIAAQAPAGPNVAGIEKVKDNLYVITGGGGNTAAFIAAGGVVLVDTKLANWGQAILDKVRTVTDKPVTHIVNTHIHSDHVGSNDFFDAKVEVVVQANTAALMAKIPLPADRTFTDRMTLLPGPDAIDLYYFGPAHTGGDAFVVFRSLRVMHSGDAFFAPTAPVMDTSNGGSGTGYADTLAKAAAGISGVDTVIPGHSPVTSWQAFVDYGEFVRSFETSVRAAASAGKTAEQAAAEFTPAGKFKAYGLQRAGANAAIIYRELGK